MKHTRHCRKTWLAVAMWVLTTLAHGQSITSISPAAASPGTAVTITGTGFGSSQGLTNTVSFAGVPSSPRVVAGSWTSTRILVTVPLSAVSGSVVVTAAGHASTPVSYTVTPLINSISPTSAVSGTSVTINGSGFGNTQAVGSSAITFNGVPATPSSWSSTTIVTQVPTAATAGPVVVTVAGQISSGSSSFTPTPVISGLSPGSGASGSTVTIAGNSFGNSQGNSRATFNGVAAAVTSWTDTSVTATIPNNTNTGPVVVAVNGVPSAGMNFTVTPGITGVSPNPGLAGSPVTITGTNFGATQGSVTFNGTVATATSWTNTLIEAIVPGNTIAGPLVVTVNGMASNAVPFSLTPPYNFTVTYAPNSDVQAAQDSVNGNWNYTYDDFNRLATASNSSPQQGFSYLYDRYGNRRQQNVTAGTGGSSILTFSGGPASTIGNCYHAAGLTNQVDGYCYDAAGNLLNDGQHNYVYDAENRLVSVDGGQASYAYDGDGQRIEKISAAGTTDYLYDLAGHAISEGNGAGTWTRSEIYAGRRHLGTYTNGTTYFIQVDWLGTERARVLPTGDMYETCVSLPFGDGLNCTGATDPSLNHFTGKERDSETGLDYFGARYYSNGLGRFITPDWAAHAITVPYANFGDPQTLNLYSYARNVPTTRLDPDGHQSGQLYYGYICTLCPQAAFEILTNPKQAGKDALQAVGALLTSVLNLLPYGDNKPSPHYVPPPSSIPVPHSAVGKMTYGAASLASLALVSESGSAVVDLTANLRAPSLLPSMVARVIPAEIDATTLALSGNVDAFVTDASAIRGMTSSQLSQGLWIPESPSGFQVIEFPTPEGIASPINRTNPGFVGGGQTQGGLPEFVVPNGPIPPNATTHVVPPSGNQL